METTNIIETTAPVAEITETGDVLITAEESAAAVAEATTAVESGIRFTPEGLAETAPIMGKGMLGIFIVMAIIILCVMLLNNLTSPERKAKKLEKKNQKAAEKANKTN